MRMSLWGIIEGSLIKVKKTKYCGFLLFGSCRFTDKACRDIHDSKEERDKKQAGIEEVRSRVFFGRRKSWSPAKLVQEQGQVFNF